MLHFINTACLAFALTTSGAGIWGHLKNYRKPVDQRLIVRILVMVPLFGLSAWLNLYSTHKWLAHLCEFIRELYEAFVIYTFYSLLTNLLGGEREIIFNATGRPPKRFLIFTLDISDPNTYWVIKRLVMQYVWMRPITSVLLKVFASHKIVNILIIVLYNISVTLALNALMAFWVCLKTDLKPYRVVLKFLSVKMIVFFSYWQSLALLALKSLGWIREDSLHVWGNSLVCWESVAFAIVHLRAFPSSDYASTFPFGFARMNVSAAFKDAFGTTDLKHDFRSTFVDAHYGIRDFDSVESVLDHPESNTRQKRIAAGLRYKNGGRSKYWLPDSSLQRLLSNSESYGAIPATSGVSASTVSGGGVATGNKTAEPVVPPTNNDEEEEHLSLDMEDEYSEGEENLYNLARNVYGDYNYPVVTVREADADISHSAQVQAYRQRILDQV